MEIAVLGIDLGKTVCSLAGLDNTGAVVFRKRVQRFRLLDFLSSLSPCIVAMEACGGAHHVGRFCLEQGHAPRLMSPLYVRPYVKVHKNDDRDAEAIAEAATRPTMSSVAIKSEEQLDLQALHRLRERLIHNRTRLINQARGFLMERGIRIGSGRHVFQKALENLTDHVEGDLSSRMLEMFEGMAIELAAINAQVAGLDAEIKSVARRDEDMCRLMEIPGVGPTIATALVAAVGRGESFGKGRDMAAWLGLVRGTSQRRCRGHGEQAGADRMGRSDKGKALSRGCLSRHVNQGRKGKRTTESAREERMDQRPIGVL